jgi:hypothetical protein
MRFRECISLLLLNIASMVRARMPPAYRITGASELTRYDGVYARMETATCHGKPVYQQAQTVDGALVTERIDPQDEAPVLYRTMSDCCGIVWEVGPSARATSCESDAAIASPWDSTPCDDFPDGAGCAGKWLEATDDCGSDSGWCTSPMLTVTAIPYIVEYQHTTAGSMAANGRQSGWPVELVLGGALGGLAVLLLGVALSAWRHRHRRATAMDPEHVPLPNPTENSDVDAEEAHDRGREPSDAESERICLTAAV